MIESIILIGLTLEDNAIVAMGYDYDCETNCIGNFRSFNSDNLNYELAYK